MAFVRKRRIWWEPVPEADHYVVYVSKDKTVFNPGMFMGDTTDRIISKLIQTT
jgi:hypothetical protein